MTKTIDQLPDIVVNSTNVLIGQKEQVDELGETGKFTIQELHDIQTIITTPTP